MVEEDEEEERGGGGGGTIPNAVTDGPRGGPPIISWGP